LDAVSFRRVPAKDTNMPATIATLENIIGIPVKPGHVRFYLGSWGWTETEPTEDPEQAEQWIPENYRRPNFGCVYALDVPEKNVYRDPYDKEKKRRTFNCTFHGYGPCGEGSYRDYRVGTKLAGKLAVETWEG